MKIIPITVIEAAQLAQKKWEVPSSVSIAQWALESNFGESVPMGSNNPFGIKARDGDPYVIARTHEFIHGRYVKLDARFRKFASIADAFDAHGKLIATLPYYKLAMDTVKPSQNGLLSHRQVANKFAEELTGIYATDPHYGTKLESIMQAGDLYQYDAPTPK